MRLKKTGERRTLGSGSSVEELVQDLFHAFPYHYIRRFTTPETRLLDVGFGDGYGAEILYGSVSEYVGVDSSDHAVSQARARYRFPNVRFMKSDGAMLPFPAASFDLVASFHVLEHIAEPDPYLTEMARVCRIGGVIVVVTPNRAFRLHQDERPWNRFHVREFDEPELKALFSKHFASTTVRGITGNVGMTEIERRRVARARRLAQFDRLGLRYRLPEPLLLRVRRAVARVSTQRAREAIELDFSLEDVRCVDCSVGDAVHLLGVIRRHETDPAGRPAA
jgi:ubiquinone/menaquinone biosynthesis C-methylase UbiE